MDILIQLILLIIFIYLYLYYYYKTKYNILYLYYGNDYNYNNIADKNNISILQNHLNTGRFNNINIPSTKDNNKDKKKLQLQLKYPKVYKSLWRLVEYLIRDFIDFWFKYVSQDPDFADDIRELLERIVSIVSEKAINIDWPQFVSKKVLLPLRDLLRIFRTVDANIRIKNPDYLNLKLEEKQKILLNEISNSFVLHSAVISESEYLRRLSTLFLSQILPPGAFRVSVIRSLLREILSNTIFKPVMGFVCPYYINLGLAMGFDYNIVNLITPGSEANNSDPDLVNTLALLDTNESDDLLLHDASAISIACSSDSNNKTAQNPQNHDSSFSPTNTLNIPKNYKNDYKFHHPDLCPVEEETEESLRAASMAMRSVKIENNANDLTNIRSNTTSNSSQLFSLEATPVKNNDIVNTAIKLEVESPSFFTRFLPNRVSDLFFSPPKKEKRKPFSFTPIKNSIENVHQSLSQGLLDFKDSTVNALNSTIDLMEEQVEKSGINRIKQSSSIASNNSFVSTNSVGRRLLRTSIVNLSAKKRENRLKENNIVASPNLILTPKRIKNDINDKATKHKHKESYLSEKITNWSTQRDLREQLSKYSQPVNEAHKAGSKRFSISSPLTSSEILDLTTLDPQERLDKFTAVTCPSVKLTNKVSNWSIAVVGAITDFDPKPFVKYLIHVSYGRDTWNICRRYNHFSEFHDALLLEVFPTSVLMPTLPAKKIWGNFDSDFIETRKTELHHYLQTIVMQKPILESDLWKEFVVKDGVDSNHSDSENSSNIAPVSVSFESLVPTLVASKSLSPSKKPVEVPALLENKKSFELNKIPDDSLVTNNSDDSQPNKSISIKGTGKFKTQSFETPDIPVISVKSDVSVEAPSVKQSTSNLTLPLYDILEEVFELHEHNWIRKQTLWMFTSIIEMSFDGIINDFLFTKVNELTTEDSLSTAIDSLTDILWPEGKWMKTPVPVSEEEKEVYAKLAFERMLSFAKNQSYINSVLGDFYIEAGLTKFFQFLQNEPLIKHLGYTILDSLMVSLFPEIEHSIVRLKSDLSCSKTADFKLPESDKIDSKKFEVSKVKSYPPPPISSSDNIDIKVFKENEAATPTTSEQLPVSKLSESLKAETELKFEINKVRSTLHSAKPDVESTRSPVNTSELERTKPSSWFNFDEGTPGGDSNPLSPSFSFRGFFGLSASVAQKSVFDISDEEKKTAVKPNKMLVKALSDSPQRNTLKLPKKVTKFEEELLLRR